MRTQLQKLTGKFSRENGRPEVTKPHALSSRAYIIDIVPFSRKQPYKNEIVLRENYLEKGLSVQQLSVLLGAKPTTIKFYLKKFGIKKTERANRHRANLRYGEKLLKGKIHDHKTENRVKDAIVRMHTIDRLSLRAIASILNEMKVPTKRRGKGWDHSVITDILTREGLYKPIRKKKGTL